MSLYHVLARDYLRYNFPRWTKELSREGKLQQQIETLAQRADDEYERLVYNHGMRPDEASEVVVADVFPPQLSEENDRPEGEPNEDYR
jgi:hypothetical protein